MQIEIKIDASYTEPKIVIFADKMTDEISEVIKKISEDSPIMITAFHKNMVELLEPDQIIRIYTSSGRVYVQTLDKTYTVRQRLYELENILSQSMFVRISNSEIINLKSVKCFDLNFSGTICVTLVNDIVTYVSRRYVSKIKKILGI